MHTAVETAQFLMILAILSVMVMGTIIVTYGRFRRGFYYKYVHSSIVDKNAPKKDIRWFIVEVMVLFFLVTTDILFCVLSCVSYSLALGGVDLVHRDGSGVILLLIFSGAGALLIVGGIFLSGYLRIVRRKKQTRSNNK